MADQDEFSETGSPQADSASSQSSAQATDVLSDDFRPDVEVDGSVETDSSVETGSEAEDGAALSEQAADDVTLDIAHDDSDDADSASGDGVGNSLPGLRASIAGAFNAEVRDLEARIRQSDLAIRQLNQAKQVQLDSSLCPRNTVFEHNRYRFVWTDAATGEQHESLTTEACQSGLCEFGKDAENSLWLQKTTSWNRYSEAKERLDQLVLDRADRLTKIQELDTQIAGLIESGALDAGDVDTDAMSQELLDPNSLSLPVIEEPMTVTASDPRTSEERARQKKKLLEAIEAGTYDSELQRPEGGMDDFRTVLPDEFHNDPDVWNAIFRLHPEQMQYLPKANLDDPNFALRLLENRGAAAERALAELPDSVRGDATFIMQLIETNWRAARDACSNDLRNDPEVALKALHYFEQDPLDTLNWLGASVKDNAFVMGAAVLMLPSSIRHASFRLRSDHDFIQDILTASLALCDQATRREASKIDISSASTFDWRVAHREQTRFRIQSRRDFWPAVEAILESTLDAPRNNEQVMLLALLHDGRSMQYASGRLQADRLFVLTAIDTFRRQLPPHYAAEACLGLCRNIDDSLRDDEELALFAIESCGGQDIMECWSERLRNDRHFVMQAMESSLYRRRLLASLPDALRDDETVVKTALSMDGSALQSAGKSLSTNKRFVLRAITASSTAETFENALNRSRAYYADHPIPGESDDVHWFAANRPLINVSDLPDELRNDADVVLACLESGASGRGMAPQLLNDPKFVRRAIDTFGRKAAYDPLQLKVGERLMAFLPERIRDNDDLMLAAIKRHGSLARYASARLKNDPSFAARAVRVSENPRATLEHVSRTMRDNDSVMGSAAEVNAEMAVALASERLKGDRNFARKAMQASENPELLKNRFSGLADDTPLPSGRKKKESTLTAADLWAVAVVILGGLLFGYVVFAVPNIDTQLPTTATIMQLAVAIMLGVGFVVSLNKVIASRREASRQTHSVEVPKDFVRARDEDDTFHYTRDGEIQGLPRNTAPRDRP